MRRQAVMVALLLVMAFSYTGCAAMGWVTRNYDKVYEVAKPYLIDNCKEVKVGLIYTFDFETEKLVHSGGFEIGGCGVKVEMQCDINKPPEQEDACHDLYVYLIKSDNVARTDLPPSWRLHESTM